MTRTWAVAALVALLLAMPFAARADFAAGAEAYDGGDYEAAFRVWMSLARAGDPTAQTAIAGMYRFGEGRQADPARAAVWYRRAAENGEPVAQMNLGEMYLLGLGVARDPLRAYLWLSLAARQGKRWAADRRDTLFRTMTADQQRQAHGMLQARPVRAPHARPADR